MPLTNCHTHVFNLNYIPPKFARDFAPKILADNVGKLLFNHTSEVVVARVLSLFGGGMRRLAGMFSIGGSPSQIDVFDILTSYYNQPATYVFLPMQMDFTGLGTPLLGAKAQLDDLILNFHNRLKQDIHVFVPVDPRTEYDPKQFVENYIRLNCTGIKLYPPLGFYPNDPRLRSLYQFAQDNNIPITTHANKGGGFYYAPDSPDINVLTPPVNITDVFNPSEEKSPTKIYQLQIKNMIESDGWSYKAKDFYNLFMNPINYYDVLQEFPKLKINFAHFGGNNEVNDMSSGKTSWDNKLLGVNGDFTRWIYYFCRTYENVYTDISYTLHDTDALKYINTLMSSSVPPGYNYPAGTDINPMSPVGNFDFSKKVLFGTDFFVVHKEDNGDDNTLLNNALQNFSPPMYQKITEINPRSFLQ